MSTDDDTGRKNLSLYHPANAFAMNLQAYIASLLPFLQCRMDIQTTDNKSMVLRYVTSYVSKFQDHGVSESLYSRHVPPAKAAYRILRDMKTLEPEMVVTLSSSKLAWTNNATKRYVPPRPNNVGDSADVSNHSLLSWLWTHDTGKGNQTLYNATQFLWSVSSMSVSNCDLWTTDAAVRALFRQKGNR